MLRYLKKVFVKNEKTQTHNKQLQRAVIRSNLLNQNLTKLNPDDLVAILEILFQKDSSQQHQIQLQFDFFSILNSNECSSVSSFKIFICLHRFIIEIGEIFCISLLEHKIPNLQIEQKQSNQFKNEIKLIDKIGQNYYNYLLRLCNNYQIYKICIDEQLLPFTDEQMVNQKLKFMWLFKIYNMLSYLINISLNFNTFFVDFPQFLFVQDAAMLILHDCVKFYNTLSIEISNLLESYPLLPSLDLIQYFQIYSELVLITQKLKTFYKTSVYFDMDQQISEPKWFVVEKKVDKEIQIYAKKIELLNSSAVGMRQIMKLANNTSPDFKYSINFTESNMNMDKFRSKSQVQTQVVNNLNDELTEKDLQKVRSQQKNTKNIQKVNEINTQDKQKLPSIQEISDNQIENDLKIEMKEEDLKAIQQYEQMLKQQIKEED